MALPSASEITSLFLYGTSTPPLDKADPAIANHPAATAVQVNRTDFMTTGPGRFGGPAQIEENSAKVCQATSIGDKLARFLRATWPPSGSIKNAEPEEEAGAFTPFLATVFTFGTVVVLVSAIFFSSAARSYPTESTSVEQQCVRSVEVGNVKWSCSIKAMRELEICPPEKRIEVENAGKSTEPLKKISDVARVRFAQLGFNDTVRWFSCQGFTIGFLGTFSVAADGQNIVDVSQIDIGLVSSKLGKSKIAIETWDKSTYFCLFSVLGVHLFCDVPPRLTFSMHLDNKGNIAKTELQPSLIAN
jgi:hypothetical protein